MLRRRWVSVGLAFLGACGEGENGDGNGTDSRGDLNGGSPVPAAYPQPDAGIRCATEYRSTLFFPALEVPRDFRYREVCSIPFNHNARDVSLLAEGGRRGHRMTPDVTGGITIMLERLDVGQYGAGSSAGVAALALDVLSLFPLTSLKSGQIPQVSVDGAEGAWIWGQYIGEVCKTNLGGEVTECRRLEGRYSSLVLNR